MEQSRGDGWVCSLPQSKSVLNLGTGSGLALANAVDRFVVPLLAFYDERGRVWTCCVAIYLCIADGATPAFSQ